MNHRVHTHILTITLIILGLIVSFGCGSKDTSATPETIAWMTDLEKAFEMAKAEDKPLMIDFMAEWCPTCQKMDATTFKSADVIEKSSQFIPVRIDVDKQGDLADSMNCNAGKYGGIGIPNILFLDREGNKLKHPIGYRKTETFLSVMDSVLAMVE